MRTLEGRRVGLLEGRQSEELGMMVSRLGGTPISAPAVREVPSGQDAGPVLRRMVDGAFQMIVVLTGAGITALFREAERLEMAEALRAQLERATVVCRGPKPLTALKKHGLKAQIVTPKPHTTAELIDALNDVSLSGVTIALLHYGERNPAFAEALVARGARVEDVCLYEWAMPEDVAPLKAMVTAAIDGSVDAMLFTSQIQFRHLQQVADGMQVTAALTEALNERIIVGAVGPVCAGALRAGGVVPDVLPASPNSASLVSALGDYFDLMTRTHEET